MDFDQLHTFLEIVRLKSFSKAAQTCFRTQPAISAQIRQMEQELGTQLFERFGSRISITTAGRIFAEHARNILETKRAAFEEIRELERVPRGEIVIAANNSACVKVLPQVFATYKERFPGVRVQVVRANAAKTAQSVLDNSVDFGILQLPVEDKKLEVVQIFSDEVRLLVPPDHALAKAGSAGPGDIVEHPLLMPKSGVTRKRILDYLEDFEDDMNISMELESSDMIKEFVAAGLGLGFMAVTNAQDEIRDGKVVAVRLEPLPMIRTIGLIYRKDKALPRAGLGFIDVIGTFARSIVDSQPARPPKSQSKRRIVS